MNSCRMTSGPGSARPQIGTPECLNERAHVRSGEMTEPEHRAPEPFIREARIFVNVLKVAIGFGLVVAVLGGLL